VSLAHYSPAEGSELLVGGLGGRCRASGQVAVGGCQEPRHGVAGKQAFLNQDEVDTLEQGQPEQTHEQCRATCTDTCIGNRAKRESGLSPEQRGEPEETKRQAAEVRADAGQVEDVMRAVVVSEPAPRVGTPVRDQQAYGPQAQEHQAEAPPSALSRDEGGQGPRDQGAPRALDQPGREGQARDVTLVEAAPDPLDLGAPRFTCREPHCNRDRVDRSAGGAHHQIEIQGDRASTIACGVLGEGHVPVGPRVLQGPEDADLVGAFRAPAGEHERDARLVLSVAGRIAAQRCADLVEAHGGRCNRLRVVGRNETPVELGVVFQGLEREGVPA
jgi:hypothetical protein